MKSIYKYLDTRLFLIGLLVLPFLAVVSCQNDDDDAIPVIHYIRVTDPAKADSTFTDVNPGTMIVVVGEHLVEHKRCISMIRRLVSTGIM